MGRTHKKKKSHKKSKKSKKKKSYKKFNSTNLKWRIAGRRIAKCMRAFTKNHSKLYGKGLGIDLQKEIGTLNPFSIQTDPIGVTRSNL